MQTTVRAPITLDGVGLHSGRPARLTIRPAVADHGVWFKRTDIRLGDTLVPAIWDSVERSPLCTRIVNAAGVAVQTIEHVMAALAGCGVHNALIEIDGPEVPILDGSAAPFVRAILDRGLRRLPEPVRALEVLAPVEIRTAKGWARLSPARGLSMRFHIDFDDAAIGTQEKTLDLSNGTFVRELSDSRTFCRQADVDAMHAQGLALGGTLENAVVVEGDRVLSPGGLRHADEAVRHKMLDALGDLALAGKPLLGHYEGFRAGHSMTNLLLHELFRNPDAFRMVEIDEDTRARLPGVNIQPQEIPAVA
ncbi:UDP-3-O-(3-hydroxymyristoyl) glucosamine N-acyltransferase [Roseivivax halodurans JCM 10272]|uniref:UDP-3-O-acyl-N-acetylglucosamine deacetylase n=1 Tax=Roseivivax halodurans JCM 10272 TaxID=1449350 RepID=X7EJS4_9RHOB|nr:UDP-3-O-acyl-N-acetylglucosamine deacetylase [Roseivivax halodurans]ETX16150.1 UDP-3-O-(3-hydroxymyristoyl) glucosamine N-acyltransferase [Roseivivax halodurans JCM 10272]